MNNLADEAMGKIFIKTVGCPKNQEDSERMAGALAAAGHEIVFDPDSADVIVVNTCGFIEDAKRESIETIFGYVPYKAEGKRLIVTGCLTQRYPEALAEELPEADAILGVDDYGQMPEVVTRLITQGAQGGAGARGDGPFGLPAATQKDRPRGLPPRLALSPRHTSYLKIAEGCSNCCAYCVIPSIRGPYRSVPMEDVVREAEALAAEGCKELVLIAQDVTYYGKDLYGDFALPELLRRLCAARGAKSIEWIRLLYCYEERITDELIRAMASEPRILHYIDIPLQHIDADILRRMNRKSTPGSIRATIARLRAAMPDIVIRTAFITGLPGETEEAFEALCEFAEETRFGRLGVFAYSREEGTAAAEMPDQVAPEVAAARADGLMHVQQGISLSQNEALVGTVLDVIVDGLEGGAEGAGECEGECEGAGEIVYLGRTRGDAPEIDNAVIFTAKDMEKGNAGGLTGKIVKILVTDAMDYDLVGVVQ